MSKELVINNQGNSGCLVEIISYFGKPAIKKYANNSEYAVRLQKQRLKQEQFPLKLSSIKVPRIYTFDENSFVMELLQMPDSIVFLERASPRTIYERLNLLFDFIDTEFELSTIKSISTEVFVRKLDDIQEKLDRDIYKRFYEKFFLYIKNIAKQNDISLPVGCCHGDLTFSNVMFSMDEECIGLIDFLDCFIETPLLDVVKLRQDTRFHWTSNRYSVDHDHLKIRIINDWLDVTINNKFKKWIELPVFTYLELMNYLRIAPYVHTFKEHLYLFNALNLIQRGK